VHILIIGLCKSMECTYIEKTNSKCLKFYSQTFLSTLHAYVLCAVKCWTKNEIKRRQKNKKNKKTRKYLDDVRYIMMAHTYNRKNAMKNSINHNGKSAKVCFRLLKVLSPCLCILWHAHQQIIIVHV
jgi:hypothetical protein